MLTRPGVARQPVPSTPGRAGGPASRPGRRRRSGRRRRPRRARRRARCRRRPPWRPRSSRCSDHDARPPAAPRPGSSRSRCSGTGCRPAPRGSPGRSAPGRGPAGRARRRPDRACRIHTGRRRPSTNASLHRVELAAPSASPSTVTHLAALRLAGGDQAGADRRRRPGTPCTSRTRPARRRSSSRAGRAARAARTAGSRPARRRRPRARSPLTVQVTRIDGTLPSARPRPSASVRRASTASACRRYAARAAHVVDRGGAASATSSPNRRASASRQRARASPTAARRPGAPRRPARARGVGAAEPMPVPTVRVGRVAAPARTSTPRSPSRCACRPWRTAAARAPAGTRTAAISSSGASTLRLGPGEERRRPAPAGCRAPTPTSTTAPAASSGGCASPAGEAEPRLPPTVPRLRICGEPTVRDASARPGSRSPSSSMIRAVRARRRRSGAVAVGVPLAQLGRPGSGRAARAAGGGRSSARP